jgi:hypothetical protein
MKENNQMGFKRDIVIDAPVEKVFEAATNVNNFKEIMVNVVEVQLLTEGPFQKGTKFKEVREIKGRKAEAIIEVLECVTNEKYSVKSENNGLFVEYRYVFKPQGEATLIQFEGIIQTKGIMNNLFKPIITSIIKKEDGDHLLYLKQFIEQHSEEVTTK